MAKIIIRRSVFFYQIFLPTSVLISTSLVILLYTCSNKASDDNAQLASNFSNESAEASGNMAVVEKDKGLWQATVQPYLQDAL